MQNSQAQEPAPDATTGTGRLAELEVDAGVGALLLPGLVHRIRNLLFAATGRMELVRGSDPARLLEWLRDAKGSLEEIGTYLDLCSGERGGGQRWLESASVSLERLVECLAFPVRERGLGFVAEVEQGLPCLVLPPAKVFRWTAVALRRLLDAIPSGMRGTLFASGTREGGDTLSIGIRYRSAPGFLPLVGELRPFEAEVLAMARGEGIELLSGCHGGGQEERGGHEVRVRAPLLVGRAACRVEAPGGASPTGRRTEVAPR